MDLDFREKFLDSYKRQKELGEKYAEAKGQSWQAQEMLSSVKAKLEKHFIDQGLPVSKAEVEAKASKDYEDYIKDCSSLLTKELRLKAQYEAEKNRFEAIRSLSSLEKRTRNLIDGEN